MNIVLEPLSEEFLETLRQWRNQNRQNFLTQGIITPGMQKKWFREYQKRTDDTIYIVFYRREPVGALAVILRGEDVEIGRVMLGKKEYARQDIMGKALEIAISKFKNRRIFLALLKTNKAALVFYKKHKFKIMGENEKSYIMERWV